MIGKYLNRYGYTDINPIGKIVDIKSKTIVIVQRVEAGENKVKMEFAPGGFSAVCLNQNKQRYDFTEIDERFKFKISNRSLKNVRIQEHPVKYYDYNF